VADEPPADEAPADTSEVEAATDAPDEQAAE
jgi:hypothetical protein